MAKRSVRGNKEADGGLRESDATANRNDAGEPEELFPGVPGADPDAVDPAAVAGPGEEEKPKRRGRGPSKRRIATAASEETSVSNLARLLYGIHAGIARLADIPEIELTEPEADVLGGAVHDVAKLYKPSWLTAEAEAWANLIVVAGAVYGPRIIATRSRKKKDDQRIATIN